MCVVFKDQRPSVVSNQTAPKIFKPATILSTKGASGKGMCAPVFAGLYQQ